MKEINHEFKKTMANIIVTLDETKHEDINSFYRFQLDEEGSYMAAFTSKDSHDEAAYIERWTKLLADPAISIRTIKAGNEIAGSVSKYVMKGKAEITYWIDRKFWGKGIASAALREFLKLERTRPIYGHVAFDNYGSQRVLEKCGFKKIGSDKGFAKARQAEIEEYIYELL